MNENRTRPGFALFLLVFIVGCASWKLVVKVDIARWPNFERDFPIVVQLVPVRGNE